MGDLASFRRKRNVFTSLARYLLPSFFSAPISGWRLQGIEVGGGGGGEGHFLHLARNCFDLCEGEGRQKSGWVRESEIL